jgi:hypothetical protein
MLQRLVYIPLFLLSAVAVAVNALRGGTNARRRLTVAPLLRHEGNSNWGSRRSLMDVFDWEMNANGSLFEDFNVSSTPAMEFYYNLTGGVPLERSFSAALYLNDCVTPANATTALTLNPTLVDDSRYQVRMELSLDTISESSYYKLLPDYSAEISFCLRVDDLYMSESIFFHDTNVTITANMTAGFELLDILIDSLGPDAASLDAAISCDVYEYFCNETYHDIGNPVYTQGDALIGCIMSTGDYQYVSIYQWFQILSELHDYSFLTLFFFSVSEILFKPIWIKIETMMVFPTFTMMS